MKVLIVCSGNKEDFKFEADQVFIYEQMIAVQRIFDVSYEIFLIENSGLKGYYKSIIQLRNKLKRENFDLLHAHYGLSGLVASFQFSVKKIITFHGTDINFWKTNLVSSLAGSLSNRNIFVSEKLSKKSWLKFKAHEIIPCGIDLKRFKIIDKNKAKNQLGLDLEKKYILFCSSFDNVIKNYPLAKSATEKVTIEHTLLELKGYSREEVQLLLCACDALLMTSFSEGSPQIIKEAMACGTPIVSTDVGEVSNIISDTQGCWVCGFDASEISSSLNKALSFEGRTDGRKNIINFDNAVIAEKIHKTYKQVLSRS
ncbi:MAG: glycosyltransferase family 4 protein [Balneola sp.]|jgi:teichuronic acid biosynthesis glycosyltransferase TuaC